MGTDEISTSHLLLPITIIIKLLTPHSLCLFFFFLSPSHSPRCLVTLAPCYLAPPILPSRRWRRGKREADREREREAAAHYHRVPRGPSACLPAPPVGHGPSCCSVRAVAQHRHPPPPPSSRDLHRATTSVSPHSRDRAPLCLPLRLFISSTLTPSTAAKPSPLVLRTVSSPHSPP